MYKRKDFLMLAFIEVLSNVLERKKLASKSVTVVVVVAIVNTQKSRLILVNMEIGCKDPLANR